MPSTNGLASLFHFGAKTWRPKTADQSYLEFEKKKHAEEVQRKRSEVQKKIQLLDHIRKLEAKTQALNQMALTAEIESKEHELAMRERQMAESRQIELAKLELAKRMGQESLDEADLSRIRRERMKAELLAHASNNHAMNELNRTLGYSEIDNPTTSHLPQPPSFMPSERFMSPHPGHMATASPIPIRGMTPMAGAYGSLPSSDPRFMPASMSSPGHMHMPLGGRHSIFDFQGGIPNGPHTHPRHMSASFPTHPGGFDRGPGDFNQGPGDFDPGPMDFERGGRGPSRNSFHESDRIFSDHFDPRQMHHANNNLFDPHEPISTQMALRAHAERLWRKRLERLDQKSRQHNLNAQALRELRKRELIASLRERGAHQREIEAQAVKLAEHDHRLNEAQLRQLRDREYHLMLEAKGLQEREIAEQIRKREEGDREILRKELQRLERELRRKEVSEAEWAIRRALEKGEGPPLGVARPTMEEIQSEGLLDDYMDGFHELNPRLQHEILSISAHHRPQSRMFGINETNQAHSSRTNTPGTSRPGGRRDDYEPVSRSSSLSRRSLREKSSPDSVTRTPPHRPSSRSLAAEDCDLSLHHTQPGPSNSRNQASLHDATLAARLQSAAVNSEINGGKRSRAGSNAGQIPDDFFHSSRHRPGGDLNSFREGRPRSSTNADLMRSHSNSSSSELAGQRSSKNGTPHSFGAGNHSRLNNEHSDHLAIGRSPLGNSEDFHSSDDTRKSMNSRPQSRSNDSRNYADIPYGLNPEEISHLSTEEIEMLLGGYGLEPSIYENVIHTKNLSQEEIERMSAEEFDAMLAQHQANYLATGMSNLNVGNNQSQRMGGLSRHTSVNGTHSSSSPQRQSSLGRVSSDSSRSLSRGPASRSHQSVSNRPDSKVNSRPATNLDRANERPPSASKSLHRNSGQHFLARDRSNDNSYPDDCTRKSIYESPNNSAEHLAEADVTVTEMKEQPGATIVKRFGKIHANSRRNSNYSHQMDTEQAGLNDRDEMHQAVKNLIAEACRSGANGIVSMRIHDLEDGSYDASGEAVLLIEH